MRGEEKRRQETRLMDVQNERMRWTRTAGSKEKGGEEDGRER